MSSLAFPLPRGFRLLMAVAFLFISGTGGPALVTAQPVAPGDVAGYRVDGASVVVDGEGMTARVTFYRPDIVRVDWHLPGTPRTDTSLAVVARPVDTPPSVAEGTGALTIRHGRTSAVVTVEKSPLRIRVADVQGNRLASEAPGAIAQGDTTWALGFTLAPDTHVYGTGERAPFNLRGRAFELKNTQQYGYVEAPPTLKINVPLFVTSSGYGLFVDTPWPLRADVGKTDTTRLALTANGGPLTYYVLTSPDVAGQTGAYTALTGRPPMPPKWALGYLQSKMGFRTEAETRAVLDTLRQKQFPVDVMIVDLYWFEHMGDLRWNRAAFPTPFDMMRDFSSRGVKTVAITEPYLTRPSRLFQPAIDRGFVGTTPSGDPYVMPDWWSCEDGCDVALLDLTNPEAQDWWWSQHPPFMGNELAGLWTDLGEPEKHPMDMQHHAGPAPAVHNTYNFLWAKTVRDGWRQARPGQRLFNLTRAGSAGIQRYGTFLWSGDVARSFRTFQDQIPLLLNASLSGLPYYGSDLGGFTGETTSPELFVRWLQHGALSPTMRVHGVDNQPTEPWRYGAEAERITRDAVRLRYRLMPYLFYTLAYEAHRTGLPLVRPLFFADPSDARLSDVGDAYLLGDALLVAPVLEEGARTRDVILPSGTWLAWATSTPLEGGQTVTVDAPLDRIPLFVKAGSIVPTRPVALHTEAQPADTLGLAVYPHPDRTATARLYEDGGQTLAYREGAHAVTRVRQTWDAEDATPDTPRTLRLRVSAAEGTYQGQPEARTMQVDVFRLAAAPSRVAVGGEALAQRDTPDAVRVQGGWTYDAARNLVHVQFRGRLDAPHVVRIEGVTVGDGS